MFIIVDGLSFVVVFIRCMIGHDGFMTIFWTIRSLMML